MQTSCIQTIHPLALFSPRHHLTLPSGPIPACLLPTYILLLTAACVPCPLSPHHVSQRRQLLQINFTPYGHRGTAVLYLPINYHSHCTECQHGSIHYYHIALASSSRHGAPNATPPQHQIRCLPGSSLWSKKPPEMILPTAKTIPTAVLIPIPVTYQSLSTILQHRPITQPS